MPYNASIHITIKSVKYRQTNRIIPTNKFVLICKLLCVSLSSWPQFVMISPEVLDKIKQKRTLLERIFNVASDDVISADNNS